MSTTLLEPAETKSAAPRVLGVLDLLTLQGLVPSESIRLVRHQDQRYPLDEMRRKGWFDHYQSYQGKPRFHDLEAIISFYGQAGTRAAFHGVYRVREHRPAQEGPVLGSCPWSAKLHGEAKFFYDLERDPRFDDLRDRLVIDWGAGTRSWVQRLANKRVLSIEEPGRSVPRFESYLDVSLSHEELRGLFRNEAAHRDWKASLSSVAGVYLILAETSGDLYVGSASGGEGIWGRWREYSQTGHGGNARLMELVARDAAYPEAFRFSVLQVLPQTMNRDEVLRHEQLFKDKLGTRATGLNLN